MSEGWSRIIMRQSMQQIIDELQPVVTMLEIGGDHWCDKRTADICDKFEGDICEKQPLLNYQLIIAEQVWEHLLYPRRAAVNVFKALSPGGHFLVAVPFMVRFHPHPFDCTRWSEMGLKHFIHDCGFPLDGIKTWSWGNRDVVIANMEQWTEYKPGEHSLENDPRFPYHVWALARK